MTRDELLRLRCTEQDWTIWQSRARVDAIWAGSAVHARRVAQARAALADFVSGEKLADDERKKREEADAAADDRLLAEGRHWGAERAQRTRKPMAERSDAVLPNGYASQ